MLADLPGYGYAAVPSEAKLRWQHVMANYLMTRESLRGVVLMCDPRHGLTELDDILLEVIRPRVEQGLKFLVLLTKADKLTRSDGAKALSIARLQAGGGEVKLFSALKQAGCGRGGRTAVALGASAGRAARRTDARRQQPMIETFARALPHGITLSCRAAGAAGRPLMVFLHGFPEAAFVWDELLEHFAKPEHGGYRCVAPNLRGFEKSSAPAEVAAYRAHLLIQDIAALAATESADGRIEALVAHDWGGAVGWGYGNLHAAQARQAGHHQLAASGHLPRELIDNPAQQAASAYMNFLVRPDAEALLAADDYKRMWPFFTLMKAGPDGFGWLTDAVKDQYRAVWDAGLTGACNLYRVTPMKPARPGPAGARPFRPCRASG